jgi:hypothetical protein
MNSRGRRPLDGRRQVDFIFRIDTYWPDPRSADADEREDLRVLDSSSAGRSVDHTYLHGLDGGGDYSAAVHVARRVAST